MGLIVCWRAFKTVGALFSETIDPSKYDALFNELQSSRKTMLPASIEGNFETEGL